MANRVVVTGMGAITPLGNSVEAYWEGLKKGKAATAPITKFDTSNLKVKLACEVKGFEATDYMDFKTMKRMEPFAHYALAAAKEAIEQSGLDMTKEDPYRVGVIVSSGIGSMQAHEREQIRFEKSGKIAPMYIPLMIPVLLPVRDPSPWRSCRNFPWWIIFWSPSAAADWPPACPP